MTICSETRQLKDTVLNLQAATGVTDQSNYGNDGTYNGGMGVTDDAFLFDGTDDYIDCGDILSELPDTKYSISAWVKTTSSSRIVVCAWGSTSTVFPFAILEVDGANFRGNGAGAVSFAKRDDAGANLGDVGGGVANDGLWHHLVVTKTTADLYTVYLDGLQVGQTTITTGTITVDTLRVGTYHGNGTNSLFFDGSIRDVRVIPRVITLTEIRELYNATARPDIAGTVLHLRPETGLVDQSGTQDPATYNGGMGVVGRRYEFDGTDDYISLPNPLATGDTVFSFAGWMYSTVGATANTFFTTGTGTNTHLYQWQGGSVYWEVNGAYDRIFASTPGTGVWFHVAATYDGTTQRLYINGVEEATGLKTTTYGSNADLQIGTRNPAGTQWHEGYLDDLRVFNVELTAAQVLSLYEGVPGYEPPLPVRQIPDTVLHLEAASGERDLSNHCNYGTFNGTNIEEDSTDDAFVFNGTDDYISVPNAGEFASGVGFTASAWIKVASLPPFATSVMVKGYGTAGEARPWWMLLIDGAGAIGLQVRNTTPSTSTATGGDVSDGEWHLVTGVYDAVAATLTTYIDAVSVATASSVAAGAYGTNSGDLELGGTHSARWWGGMMDDARVIAHAASAGEVTNLYNKGVKRYRPVGLLGGEVLSYHLSRHDVGVLPDTVLQLDGSTGVTDQSPAGNDGTLEGSAVVTDGKFVLDGVDSYVESPAVFGGYPFTMSARFKADGIGGGLIISVAGDDTYYHSIELTVGKVRIRAYDGTSYYATGATTVVAGIWYHVVAVFRSASDRELYLEGVTEATDTSTENGNVGYTKCRLGVSADTTPFNYFDGEIDDARLITRDVSATEVTTLFNEDITDESGSGNVGTLTNGAYIGESDEIVFDGSNDYVGLTPTILQNEAVFTISAYVNLTSIGTISTIFSESTGTVAGNARIFFAVDSSGYLWIAGRFDDSTYKSFVSSTLLLTAGQDHHVAVVVDSTSNDWTLYLDGVSDTEATTLNAIANTASLNAQIGMFGSASYWGGSIKDLRVFNRALTAAEVAFLASEYEVETPNTKGSVLSIVPSFDDWGNATLNAIDFSGSGNVGTLTNMTTGDWVADTDSGGTRALDFDGVDDQVTASAANVNAETGTVSLWIKDEQASSTTSDAKYFYDVEGVRHAFFRTNNANKVQVYIDGRAKTFTVSYAANVWVHWAFVFDKPSDTIRVWQDGTEIVQGLTGTWGSTAVGAELHIGQAHNDAFPLDGMADGVYTWDRVLSLDEIKALASTRNYFDCPDIVVPGIDNGVILLMGVGH